MKKLVREWTYDDLSTYGNRRACDGQWSMVLAMCFASFYSTLPKVSKPSLFNRSKRKKQIIERENYVRDNIGNLFNLAEIPNLSIDIETGEIDYGDEEECTSQN